MWRQVMSGEAGNLLRRQVRSLRLGSPLQSKFGVLSSLRFPGGLDSVSGCQSKVGYSSSSKEAVEEGLLIDTLEVMRGFERSGMKRAEADELTRHITKLILQTSNQFSAKFASQAYLEKLSGQLGDEMKGFKSEILKTQELQLDSLQKEIEGAKDELSKLRTEIRYELDKLISSQRLDLNLEKGRLRDELQAMSHNVQTIETQLHKDLNNIRTGIEANKNELIKYSIGLLVSAGAVTLGILRFLV